jgi:hypothetical protein
MDILLLKRYLHYPWKNVVIYMCTQINCKYALQTLRQLLKSLKNKHNWYTERKLQKREKVEDKNGNKDKRQ